MSPKRVNGGGGGDTDLDSPCCGLQDRFAIVQALESCCVCWAACKNKDLGNCCDARDFVGIAGRELAYGRGEGGGKLTRQGGDRT